ncbi:Aste57867_11413 [Aphanomyces stellatus]|uniref:Aste57867_11413 protein n=1 Tax=Aphanomyces stellatus TaxID=120398 RepID=A0A485KU23_9STRA|nr:hypothetical protein As57867_011371 [Aphanomyces stellatus]VFT88274.1 Aste57867_11413 [Aphanomyces stellatus]
METDKLLWLARPAPLYSWPAVREEASTIWHMAWKISLATFCRLSVFTISTAFLGHLGTKELAASALAQSVIGALRIVTWAFSTSMSTLCGQAYGAKNFELVGIWLQMGVVVLTVVSIPLVVAHFYAFVVLQYVTSDVELLEMAQTFASYTALSVVPNAFYVALRSYLRAQQIVTPTAVIDTANVFLSIGANYVFIYGCFGWSGFGFIGSPLASFFCTTVQPLALYLYAFVVCQYHTKTWGGWSWQCVDPARLKQFLALTSTFLIYLALDEWIYNVLTIVAAQLGSLNLAANSILFNIWGLAYGVYLGFSTPLQVRASHALGANDPAKAKQVTLVGFCLGSIATLVVMLVLVVGRGPLMTVFTQDPDLQAILATILPIFGFAVSISGLHVMLSSVLEAMSLALTLVVVSGVGSWLVLLPVSYAWGIASGFGLAGLWWGSVVGEGAKFVMTSVALFWLYDWSEIAARVAAEAAADAMDEQVDLENEALVAVDSMKSPVSAATNASY